jgi:hypothetical protein
MTTTSQPESPAITHRLAQIEAQTRRLRRLGVYLLVGVAAILGVACSIVLVAARHGMPGLVAQVTESQKYLLRDGQGQIRAVLGTNGEGIAQLELKDVGGRTRLRFSVLPDGASGVAFVDSAGHSRLVMGLLSDETSTLVLADRRGKTRTVLGLGADGASTLVFADGSGTTRAGLGVDGRGLGTFTLSDRTGGQSHEEPDTEPASPDSASVPSRSSR